MAKVKHTPTKKTIAEVKVFRYESDLCTSCLPEIEFFIRRNDIDVVSVSVIKSDEGIFLAELRYTEMSG